MENENHAIRSLIAESANMTALVEYQGGAVVSRTIIESNTGTVTLFAFDKGQGLSEHTASFDALVYVIDGEASLTISGRSMPLRTGEATIMPANKPHALKAVDRFKMMLVMIKGS